MAQKISATHVALGRQIKRWRVECGYTQESFGRHVGLHRTYVGGLERGEKNMCFTNLLKVSTGLGLHPRDLMADLEIDPDVVRALPPDGSERHEPT